MGEGFSPESSQKRPLAKAKPASYDAPVMAGSLVRDSRSFASGATDILQSEEKSFRRQARRSWFENLKQALGLGPKQKKKDAAKRSSMKD